MDFLWFLMLSYIDGRSFISRDYDFLPDPSHLKFVYFKLVFSGGFKGKTFLVND
jgi:hypothetical protein